jgi:hypothetical protein
VSTSADAATGHIEREVVGEVGGGRRERGVGEGGGGRSLARYRGREELARRVPLPVPLELRLLRGRAVVQRWVIL